MNEVGRISAIYRYPVKSMAGEQMSSAQLGWHGLDGDRRLAFVRRGVKTGMPWLTGGKLASLVFGGLVIGALWKSLSWIFNLFRTEIDYSTPRSSQFPNATVNVDISP